MIGIPATASLYARRGHKRVHGWLTPADIQLIATLSTMQGRLGIAGPVCEIGVHHGRSLILLHLLEPVHHALAIDLFSMQSENVDHSGEGSRRRFLENLSRHGGDRSRVVVLEENSLRVTAEQIVDLAGGRPRIFSIDGGHTPECTYNDLRLAFASCAANGAIVVDDYFNPHWPGVAEGVAQFLSDHRGSITLIGIGSNKTIFTNGEARLYGDLCRSLDVRLTLRQRFARSAIWKQVKKLRGGINRSDRGLPARGS